MTQRAAFQVQVLEKLGAPLLAAAGSVAAGQPAAETADFMQEAERVAELLGKTVQVGIGLTTEMDLKAADGESDSVRLALAALAAPLVADQYRQSARTPGEAETKRMIKALQAVLTFSDNFAPAAENTARLEALDSGAPPADETQAAIQYVRALVPVVSAVTAFPFGRPETALAQEVATRLVEKAERVAESLVGGAAPPPEKRRAELGVLAALALLYVDSHREEMTRLLRLDDQARAAAAEQAGGLLPMDTVWRAFDMRADMLAVLGGNLFGGAATGGSTVAPAPAADPPSAAPAAPVAEPPAPPAAAAPPPAAPEPPSSETPPGGQDQGGGYNPMSFFKPSENKAPPDGGTEG